MLVIRKSDSRIFAFGAACSIDAKGIYSPGQFLPFSALSSSGVTPTQADFEVVATNAAPSGHYHQGFSHQWSGSAIESVPGYNPPTPPAPTEGRDLTKREFLTVTTAVDAVKTNTILAKLPLAAEFLNDYQDDAGIQFADIDEPSSKLAILLAMASNHVVLDEPVIDAIKAKWIELYPKV